jgi:hypothetical protein
MIETTVEQLKSIVSELQNSIMLDIEDVKKARHESLVQRNNVKLDLMDNLSGLKQQLNEELSAEYEKGVDITIYKSSIDELESQLGELYRANGKLASIVLPVKEMYKEIIDELTIQNGGALVEVMA